MKLAGGEDKGTGELVLSGSADDFSALSAALRLGHSQDLILEGMEPADPRSLYVRPLTSLRIEINDEMVSIEVGESFAVISGAPPTLVRLAEEIDAFMQYNDLEEPGMHAHVDAAGALLGPAFLREGSRGLFLEGPNMNTPPAAP